MQWFRVMAAAFLLLAAGCGQKFPPTSGGKTAATWAEILEQPKVEPRRTAATKLGSLIDIDPAAMPALLKALKDEDAEVRANAVRSVGIYGGAKSAEILPVLEEMKSKDGSSKVREAAEQAIGRLTRKSPAG